MKPLPSLIAVDGSRITELSLQRGLRVNILAGALGMSWAAMCQGMPLTMLLEALGASGVTMGLLSTVAQLAFLIQIPSTFLIERLSSRKRYWAPIVLASRAVWFVPCLLLMLLPNRPALIANSMVWLMALSSAMGMAVTAAWYSWMADLVPDRIRGRFWGVRQSWVTLAFLVAMAAAGWLLDVFPSPRDGGSWTGFSLVFALGTVLGCADIVVHLGVPEPRPGAPDVSGRWYEHILRPLRDSDFRRLTFAMGAYFFAIGLTALGFVYLKREFHVTYSQLAALGIAGSLGTALFGIACGYILDRIGGRAFAVILVALAPLSGVAWLFVKNYSTDLPGLLESVRGFGSLTRAALELLPDRWAAWLCAYSLPQPVWLILFATFAAGALYGGIGLAQVNLASALAPREGRTMAMAVYWSAVGVIGAFGALIAGRCMDFFAAHPVAYVLPTGARLSFHHVLVVLHMLTLWIVVLPLLLGLRRAANEPPLAKAFSRLLVLNPLRAMANIYTMGASVSPSQRARAVRRLGAGRTAIAVSDLIEKLDDASFEVREEAAYALGAIGSAEAVDALVARLDSPDTDLAPQIAHALRLAPSLRSVDALLRRLRDPDRETQFECARTLGEIGDRRAVRPLLELLARSGEVKIMSAVAEALARLGEVTAVYDIVPRMRQTKSPPLRRSLAVAVGDLIGEREGFYRVLTREQETRGSESQRLLRELRAGIRRLAGAERIPEAEALSALAAEAERFYEDGDFTACARRLYELALGLGELRFGARLHGEDTLSIGARLALHDARFGVGVWYLDALQDPHAPSDPHAYVDVLLGIYFLATRGV